MSRMSQNLNATSPTSNQKQNFRRNAIDIEAEYICVRFEVFTGEHIASIMKVRIISN
jgi:hypothetical protein